MTKYNAQNRLVSCLNQSLEQERARKKKSTDEILGLLERLDEKATEKLKRQVDNNGRFSRVSS